MLEDKERRKAIPPIGYIISWTTEEKLNAIKYFFRNKDIYIIPYLAKNIHDESWSSYEGNPKSDSVSCLTTALLGRITEIPIWNSCVYTGITREEVTERKEKWEKWFQEEYPSWLAEQSK